MLQAFSGKKSLSLKICVVLEFVKWLAISTKQTNKQLNQK